MSDHSDGYRGIWFTLDQFSEYGDKYSGGLGTYTAKHVPMAIHAAEAKKTFFVYGGARHDNERHLLAMAGCFDHERGVVTRPTIVHDKQGVDDPHDNPSIMLAGDGHVWVFVSGRARIRPGYKYRSTKPYSVEHFELFREEEITYPQPWWIPGEGCLHLFTMYTGLRELYWNRSRDGRSWTEPSKLAGMEGHYQTSRRLGTRVITAFNRHPQQKPNLRTDLYYVETRDLGETWQTVDGCDIEPPLVDPRCEALVRSYSDEGVRVYMKDIGFDAEERPVLLYIASRHSKPGPGGDPRSWTIAHWRGDRWAFCEVTRSTHNYDTGSLDLRDDGAWRVIGPTEPGPQHWGTGGEIAIWLSHDRGETWRRDRTITADSPRNHGYVRRPIDAHEDFDAFWCDGNPDELSISRLYFTNRAGDRVWRLPAAMSDDVAAPEAVS